MGKKNYSEVDSFLSKYDPDGKLLENYKEITPSEWIHSGSYALNAAMSGSLLRGYPNNKIICIAGDPKSGKSYLALSAAREAQKMGYFVWMFETENAPDAERFENQGVDKTMLRLSQPESVFSIQSSFMKYSEELLALKKAGKEIPKILIVIDSLTGLNSSKQLRDALEGKDTTDMGTKAREIKEMLNMMSLRCGKLSIPIIMTAHIYEKDMYTFKERKVSGGNGILFLSSIVIWVRKRMDRNKETKENLGIFVDIDVVESRYAIQNRVNLYIPFHKTMNQYLGLQAVSTWDNCGIDKGKVTEFVDIAYELWFKKMLDESKIGKRFKISEVRKVLAKAKSADLEQHLTKMVDDGYIIFEEEDNFVFTDKLKERFKDGKYEKIEGVIHSLNPNSPTWVAKHINESIQSKDLFTSKVFTQEVLGKLDESVIKPKYEFSKYDDDKELEES